MKEEENGSEKGNGRDWIDTAAVAACDLHLCVERLVDAGINRICYSYFYVTKCCTSINS